MEYMMQCGLISADRDAESPLLMVNPKNVAAFAQRSSVAGENHLHHQSATILDPPYGTQRWLLGYVHVCAPAGKSR